MFPLRCAQRRSLLPLVAHRECSRSYHASLNRCNVAQKYLERVQKRAEEQGVSVDELKQKVKENIRPKPLPEASLLQELPEKSLGSKESDQKLPNVRDSGERKDGSPVKPLSDIMDIHKVLRTPHTAEQISTLWTAFHASRSGGTGRGYLCASVPSITYEKLVETGKKFPSFILPVIREATEAKPPADNREAATGYEFFFLQWSFYPAPPLPRPGILDEPLPPNVAPPAPIHPLATILFTPLLEYKTRQTFATPHLVLTMYPDLASTHQLVLLRGELTPSPAGNGKYMLSQQDAQLLALGLQRFYLPSTGAEHYGPPGAKERAELLRTFNDNPSEFQWEELLKHANPTS